MRELFRAGAVSRRCQCEYVCDDLLWRIGEYEPTGERWSYGGMSAGSSGVSFIFAEERGKQWKTPIVYWSFP